MDPELFGQESTCRAIFLPVWYRIFLDLIFLFFNFSISIVLRGYPQKEFRNHFFPEGFRFLTMFLTLRLFVSGMPPEEALADLRKRISNYENAYQQVTNNQVSYIKLFDLRYE